MGFRVNENPFIRGNPKNCPCAHSDPYHVHGFSSYRKSVYMVRFGKNRPPRLINDSNHLLGGGRTCPAENWHLLAVKCSIYGDRRRRRRRSNVLHNNVQTRKLRLKVNYQVRERAKMGIFKKIRKSPKFEHFEALEPIWGNLGFPQNRFA